MVPGSKPVLQTLHLVASLAAPQAPLAEVLTVVLEEMIVILAETRTGAADDFVRGESGWHARSDADTPPATENLERNLFHGSTGQEPGNSTAVDDLACAKIDAMVDVSDPLCDEMCPGWGFLVGAQAMVAALYSRGRRDGHQRCFHRKLRFNSRSRPNAKRGYSGARATPR